jgi:hypothetical protein
MTRLVWLAVAAFALAYPLATLATGNTRFPTRDECVHPATGDGEVDAVFGYFDDPRPAAEVHRRALAVGFEGTEMGWNACGRVRVYLAGIPTLEIGRKFAEEARKVGFDVSLEQAA